MDSAEFINMFQHKKIEKKTTFARTVQLTIFTLKNEYGDWIFLQSWTMGRKY